MEDERIKSRKKAINKFDPIYILLDRIVFKSLFKPPNASKPDGFEKIETAEVDFLVENLKKHRKILWVNIVVAIYLCLYGLDSIITFGRPEIVISGLLAPAMITGAAWFAVSFGGIPEKFINIAVSLTLAMFLAFTLSMTLLTLLLIKLTPWLIGLAIILPIYICLYLASMLYDNVDGLKIGLDSTMLKFSRATIAHHLKSGMVTIAETQHETFKEDSSMPSDQIALFMYHLRTLERNVTQLQEEKALKIANYLIASSTDLLFNILDLVYRFKEYAEIERGAEFDDFINTAHLMDQKDVDRLTFEYLKTIVAKLKTEIGDVASAEISKIENNLIQFSNIIPEEDSITKEEKEDENLTDEQKEAKKKAKEEKEKEEQHFADLIFSQTFRQLQELIGAYRHLLFNKN